MIRSSFCKKIDLNVGVKILKSKVHQNRINSEIILHSILNRYFCGKLSVFLSDGFTESKRNMKRIIEYRKLFDVTREADLAQLKKVYRNLVKEWHPDKFQDGDPKKAEAELKSQEIIEAYSFLVSISPETHALSKDEYAEVISTQMIEDFQYKGMAMKITFQNGNVYEYFNVQPSVYNKMRSTPTLERFARRHILSSYTYRKVMNTKGDN